MKRGIRPEKITEKIQKVFIADGHGYLRTGLNKFLSQQGGKISIGLCQLHGQELQLLLRQTESSGRRILRLESNIVGIKSFLLIKHRPTPIQFILKSHPEVTFRFLCLLQYNGIKMLNLTKLLQ